MSFPYTRLRRLRGSKSIRNMVCETTLTTNDFVMPLFVCPGSCVTEPIESMPGVNHYSVDMLPEVCAEISKAGINAVLLFGVPEYKDEEGSSAWDETQPVQQAIEVIKETHPQLTVITDVCLCAYTSHGHCGVGENIDNDMTLELLAKVALSHAHAGADIVAPSDMMDGRVGVIRQELDAEGFIDTAIMSYAVKYSSAYYGPFRDAAHSTPESGDRKSHQMNPANSREAMREAEFDVEEGADIIMVKPALAYLDIVKQMRDNFKTPVAAYNVSGEYSMVKAAAAKGWICEKDVVLENLLSMKRAGADIIITYHALDAARWLNEAK